MKISELGNTLNGEKIPNNIGMYPAYGGNGIIKFVDKYNYLEKTIIIGRVGANCGSVYYSPTKCWVTDNALAFSVNEKNDSYFVYLLLQILDLNNFNIGSSQPLLTQTIINNIDYNYVDDYSEQCKISNIIKIIDDKIENNNKINDELESMAKTLYDYWFLQFEFPNEEGKPYKSSGGKMVWNDELKKEIPIGWEYSEFKDIIDVLESGDRPKGGIDKDFKEGIPSIGAENIISIGKYDFSNDKYIPTEYFYSLNKGVVKSNDILLYKDGAGIGQVSMAKNNFPHKECAVNSHVFIIRSKEKNLYQNYIYLTLEKSYIKKILISLAMKAAQPGLNQKNVEAVKFIIPNRDIILKFNNLIDLYFDKIFANANENKELQELRDFLLPMLMNGQIGFKEDKELAEANA